MGLGTYLWGFQDPGIKEGRQLDNEWALVDSDNKPGARRDNQKIACIHDSLHHSNQVPQWLQTCHLR